HHHRSISLNCAHAAHGKLLISHIGIAKGGIGRRTSNDLRTVVDGVSKSIIEADLITSSHADHDTVHIHNAWTIAGLKIPGKLHILTDVDQQITQRHGLTKRLQVLLVVIVSGLIISFEYLHGVALSDLIHG